MRTAGYHADGDVDNDGGFFVNLFPDWLLLVSAWATVSIITTSPRQPRMHEWPTCPSLAGSSLRSQLPTESADAMPPLPELPFADDVMATASGDLDASRALLQRPLSIGDALFASTLTVASIFTGVALGGHQP
ncbi:MAG: hypothetical protein M3063_12465 [Actinomycetota bacterium]|nr:hypothetical protein [Actinomycetota bacterium]